MSLRDALAKGGVGEVQQPADFLAGVAGEGEKGREAEGGGELGEYAVAPSVAGVRAWSASPTLNVR